MGLRRTFAIPAVLAVVSGTGLVTALLSSGDGDAISALAVAAPVVAVCASYAWNFAAQMRSKAREKRRQ